MEGLDHVVILYTVLLAHGPFGIQHLAAFPARIAIQVGGEDAFLGLIPVEDVVDANIQTALPRQNFCDSHGQKIWADLKSAHCKSGFIV